jgi:hypothetical protein
MQWECHNAKPSVPKGFEVLRTDAGRCPIFDPDKWDVGEQELVDDDHRQAPIYDCLDGHRVIWHGINDETVNGGAPDGALIAFPALQEQ